jgi:hypothetical protein
MSVLGVLGGGIIAAKYDAMTGKKDSERLTPLGFVEQTL